VDGLPDERGAVEVGLAETGLADTGLVDVGFAEGAGFEAIARSDAADSSTSGLASGTAEAEGARSMRSMP